MQNEKFNISVDVGVGDSSSGQYGYVYGYGGDFVELYDGDSCVELFELYLQCVQYEWEFDGQWEFGVGCREYLLFQFYGGGGGLCC